MNQRTHTCLAVRAIGLLEDSGADPNLIKLLKTKLSKTAIGAWIPDLQDSKLGSGKIDNHVLKMMPLPKEDKRFVLPKKELIKVLGPERRMSQYLGSDNKLDSNWWNGSYKATPTPGQHLGNRANSLSITIIDLLILGDKPLSDLVPGNISFSTDLEIGIQTRIEQAGIYFFMLSHFIADSCMPMHCDARRLNGFDKGLHHELEMHWSDLIPSFFDDKKILKTDKNSDEIISESKKIDTIFNLNFSNIVPDLGKDADVWTEIVMICRASFAISCILNPLTSSYNINQKGKKYDELFSGEEGESLLKAIDSVIIHDAVLNIAIIWKYIWSRFN